MIETKSRSNVGRDAVNRRWNAQRNKSGKEWAAGLVKTIQELTVDGVFQAPLVEAEIGIVPELPPDQEVDGELGYDDEEQ